MWNLAQFLNRLNCCEKFWNRFECFHSFELYFMSRKWRSQCKKPPDCAGKTWKLTISLSGVIHVIKCYLKNRLETETETKIMWNMNKALRWLYFHNLTRVKNHDVYGCSSIFFFCTREMSQVLRWFLMNVFIPYRPTGSLFLVLLSFSLKSKIDFQWRTLTWENALLKLPKKLTEL